MSSNVYTSRAAERVLFLERFENPAKVHRNGGILVGDPVIKDGMVCTGSERAEMAVAASRFGSSQLSFEWKFSPDFDWNDDNISYISDASPSTRYTLLKYNSASSYSLRFYCGGTNVLSAALAPWAAYWNAGEENTVIVSCDASGSNQMYLNGTLIQSSATAWTPSLDLALLVLGSANGGGSNFAGTFHHLAIRATLLTQADVDAIESGRLWTYI